MMLISSRTGVVAQGPTSLQMFPSPSLTCGLPANETIYDHLDGIRLRETHPPYAEPEVVMIFKKSEVDEIDMNEIEQNLKRNLEEVRMLSILFLFTNGWKCNLQYLDNMIFVHSFVFLS